MNAPHKHAEILRAIADGKKIECRINHRGHHGVWLEANLHDVCNDPGDMEYRIAPETITVNGVECPKPKTTGEPYPNKAWTLSIRVRNEDDTCFDTEVYVFKNAADARTVFDALCKPFKEGV